MKRRFCAVLVVLALAAPAHAGWSSLGRMPAPQKNGQGLLFRNEQGTVRVTRNGKQLRELGAGDFIGEIALVADVPRTATVTATSPVRLLVVTDRAFRGLLEQMPSLAKKVLQSLGERLHADAV